MEAYVSLVNSSHMTTPRNSISPLENEMTIIMPIRHVYIKDVETLSLL